MVCSADDSFGPKWFKTSVCPACLDPSVLICEMNQADASGEQRGGTPKEHRLSGTSWATLGGPVSQPISSRVKWY